MARTQLQPTTLASDNNVSNLTTLLTTGGNANALVPSTGTGNGVTFTNIPGQTMVGFSLGSTACTVTLLAGMASLPLSGQNLTIVLPTSALSWIGGIHSVLDQPGTVQVAMDFSANTNLVVAVFQLPALY